MTTHSAREKWDKIYSGQTGTAEPCWVLSSYAYLLPGNGTAVDVASGRGGNALYLAASGLQTTAIDISPVGLEQLQATAQQRSLAIHTRAEPVSEGSLGEAQWDVVVVSNYLQRDLFAGIARALKPDGLLFYETFVKNKCDSSAGPGNPEYLLDNNELLNAFSDLSIRVYIDLQTTGHREEGLRNKACVVAQKI